MIYLVGHYHAAAVYGHTHGIDTSSLNHDVRVVVDESRVQGLRPRPSDSIVLLHGSTDSQMTAYDRLIHERELARQRRDASLRQAP